MQGARGNGTIAREREMAVFKFRQFQVRQERSGMKVCTDATLFGAMAPVSRGDKVLDIGAGTGLLALMAAQMGASMTTAVELTEEACSEARENFHLAPWSDKLIAINQDIRDFAHKAVEDFDLIICNPPFFDGDSRPRASSRCKARHAAYLPPDSLISVVSALLRPEGLFYVLVPRNKIDVFSSLSMGSGLKLFSRVDFRGFSHTRSKISALVFSRYPPAFCSRTITIYSAPREYTSVAAHYLLPFMLRFAPDVPGSRINFSPFP